MHRILKRRSVRIGLWVASLIVFVLFMLWQRCGLKGCLDIDGVRINKPNTARRAWPAQRGALSVALVGTLPAAAGCSSFFCRSGSSFSSRP